MAWLIEPPLRAGAESRRRFGTMTDATATATYLPPPPAPPRRGWVASLHLGQVIILSVLLLASPCIPAGVYLWVLNKTPTLAERVGYTGSDPKILKAIRTSHSQLSQAVADTGRAGVLRGYDVPADVADSITAAHPGAFDVVPLVRAAYVANGLLVDTSNVVRHRSVSSQAMVVLPIAVLLALAGLVTLWWQWFGGRRARTA